MDPAGLRSHFSVLARVAYMNAGTNGPVDAGAVAAAQRELDSALHEGRTVLHFARRIELQAQLRSRYAALLGCDSGEVALTTSTSEGLGRVLAGLQIGPGDEILTSDQEHPGLLGPLRAARARGARIRFGPLSRLAEHVTAETTLVACSHVGWLGGELADPSLADLPVPVVFDGAQGLGAVPVDVRALNCGAYAAAGQKWLCGADGTGLLYVSPGLLERLVPIAPSYTSFADPARGIDAPLQPDASRHDTPSLARESVAFNVAAYDTLDSVGWAAVFERASRLSEELAGALAESGRAVAPRGETTLVAWEEPEPAATRQRLAEAGVIVRDLPNTPYLRASVGAWNNPDDLQLLLSLL